MDIFTSHPSEQGVDPNALHAFLNAIDSDPRIEPHGLIIHRHGHRIAEGYWAPHTAERTRLVYSLSKSFTGTALGLQIGEGRLTLDDLVSDHLPEMFDGAADATRRMKIRHIASMATGHDREMLLEARAADPGNPVRSFFGIPPDAEPGTLFAYNQPPVLALAMILQRLAGERLVDYLKPRLLEPLGISGFRWAQAQPGVDMGFSGVYTNLDAVARLGQLYLDDGMWNGQRVLPEGWVADASRVHIENPQRIEPDWRQGYGFQLWMSQHGYRGDGAYGQYMVVLPAYDAMIAMFSCIEQMQVVLDLMWEHLLPGMGANRSATTEDAALADRLTGLALPTAIQHRGGEPAQPANQSFQPAQHNPLSQRSITSVEIADNTMVVHEGDAAIHVPLNNEWTINSDGAVAASSTALLDGTIAVSLLFLDTPHRLEVELKASESTFSSKWGHMPLFGAGLAPKLQSLRAPST